MVVYVGICWDCQKVEVYGSVEASNEFKKDHATHEGDSIVEPKIVRGDIRRKEKTQKAPWRRIKKTLIFGRGMQASKVELECGHSAYTTSATKARCRDCQREEK